MNKIIELDKNWEKIGEYIDSKYWIDGKSRALLQKLSTKESEVFNPGDKVAGGHLEVFGFGERIYRNKITKEEIRMPRIFNDIWPLKTKIQFI